MKVYGNVKWLAWSRGGEAELNIVLAKAEGSARSSGSSAGSFVSDSFLVFSIGGGAFS